MPNMSYCRFHNTRLDLQDCYDHMYDPARNDDEPYDDSIETISAVEAKERDKLIKLCRDIVEEFDETFHNCCSCE